MEIENMAVNDHVYEITKLKKRKTRRGKRKNRTPTKSSLEVEELESCCELCQVGRTPRKRRRGTLIRPMYSPKAPQNSTQFIIDDRIIDIPSPDSVYKCNNECDEFNVYFDTRTSPDSESMFDDWGVDKLDVESSRLSDTCYFMERNFENEYRNARSQELANLTNSELCNVIMTMENEASLLENEVEKLSKKPGTNKRGARFRDFVFKMTTENDRLKSENGRLREKLKILAQK